ncbi:hypothetical protein BU24DRAFT_460075 [Aaosphaeria arxii CBS 175.79]|uniref:Uncharacterized protein n=1 Tax=Aaosphaeria arxii CBS 175.79 TaxID=1450172 RepID=A0A6A5XUH4_9PLEO|nr:uncharacterized protein BU24DRAFT_460075 [Aaosphaeria arxii CBS 175.79]KAF2016968.1 hypothetical protein BU24DRAFT_460075 [Aaosphaeria arxii CBS 175.79]
MRLNSFAALFAASSLLLGAAAGPVAAKRQENDATTASETATASASGTESASTSEVTSSTRVLPSVGLIVSTLSNGEKTTIEVVAPNPTPGAKTTGDEDSEPTPTSNTYTFSRTGLPVPASTIFPVCNDANAKPFCLPSNESTLYVGKTYYATWNADFFPKNSTVLIKVLYSNDTTEEVWSSEKTPNGWGFVAIETTKSWKQGYDRFNLSLQAINYDNNEGGKAETFQGPMFLLQDEPTRHYEPPPPTKFNKEGLLIGLPVGLGCMILIIAGLLFGMRKHRQIGLGNIMGRRNRGYGARKSKRERLGLGKKGAIRLEEREAASDWHDARVRGNSLGSLVSDDGIRPGRGNQFRDEIQRQKTGRMD